MTEGKVNWQWTCPICHGFFQYIMFAGSPVKVCDKCKLEKGKVAKREVVIKMGFCLNCKKRFHGSPHDSLCPTCLIKEFVKMDHGDASGYLYANLKYREMKESEKSAKRNTRVAYAQATRAVEKQAETDSRDLFWNSYPTDMLTPAQRKHFKKVMRIEVRE